MRVPQPVAGAALSLSRWSWLFAEVFLVVYTGVPGLGTGRESGRAVW